MGRSSFQDTFTKEQKKDSLLTYDDAAFLFFLGALVLCALVPLTYWAWVKPIMRWSTDKFGKTPITKSIDCKCSLCQTKRTTRNLQHHKKYKSLNLRIIAKFICLFSWAAFAILVLKLQQTHLELQKFDPYEILGVDRPRARFQIPKYHTRWVRDTSKADNVDEAFRREVKRQFRRLSMIYHPDKNLNDPAAAAKFLLISKAHQALTDPVSRHNYEEYGNPDGPETMKVGIGLPAFLMAEKNQLWFLTIFFIILLIGVPGLFFYAYQSFSKYSANGTTYETLRLLTYTLTNSKRVKDLPELVAAALECRELKFPLKDAVTAENNLKTLIAEIPEKVVNYSDPTVKRNFCLITAHMNRMHHLIDPPCQALCDSILKASLPICRSILDIATIRDWGTIFETVIDFRRCLIQAIDKKTKQLFQVPHLDTTTLAKIQKSKKFVKTLSDFATLVAKGDPVLDVLEPCVKADVVEFFKRFQPLTIETVDIRVSDETHIVAGDIATCSINFKRGDSINDKNLSPLGTVHAPLFPLELVESWIICLKNRDTDALLHWVSCQVPFGDSVQRLKFHATKSGKLSLRLHCFNDCYFGLDLVHDFSVYVSSSHEVKRETVVHPEDAELDKMPTVLQQLVTLPQNEENSSEEEEELEYLPRVGTYVLKDKRLDNVKDPLSDLE